MKGKALFATWLVAFVLPVIAQPLQLVVVVFVGSAAEDVATVSQ